MAKVINRKIRFFRWLNSGMVLPLFAMAVTSTLLLYVVLFFFVR